jgi:hypothetical protein
MGLSPRRGGPGSLRKKKKMAGALVGVEPQTYGLIIEDKYNSLTSALCKEDTRFVFIILSHLDSLHKISLIYIRLPIGVNKLPRKSGRSGENCGINGINERETGVYACTQEIRKERRKLWNQWN